MYRVDKKTGIFLDQITLQRLMIERRVICQKFQNFIYIEVLNLHVNILCLICITLQYPQNCIEFENDA